MNPVRPNPYDYASADDYYDAVEEYNRLTSEEYLTEAAEQVYEAYKNQILTDQD